MVTEKTGLLNRFKQGLQRARQHMLADLSTLLSKGTVWDADMALALEDLLLSADIGMATTEQLIERLQKRLPKQLSDHNVVYTTLQQQMLEILTENTLPPPEETTQSPKVILITGVNGVGKTTTIGKLANYYKTRQHSVMLAAADTFRAAANEQLSLWAEQLQLPIITAKAQHDPASVAYTALQSASAQAIDYLLIDTAGRLHNHKPLMDELQKIHRVIRKFNSALPLEIMLIIDASTGQNAITQARQFNATVPIDSLCLTKLDGTAKGGIVFPLVCELKIPVRFVGFGETAQDLKPFSAEEYVTSLLARDPP